MVSEANLIEQVNKVGAREVAQQLRAFAALQEVRSLVPNVQIRWHLTSSNSRGSDTLI